MTAHDVLATQRNDLCVMQCLLHISTPAMKASVPVCIETKATGVVLA